MLGLFWFLLLSGAAASSSATQAAGVGNVHHVPPLPYVPPLATSYAGRLTSAILAACNLRLYRRHRSFSTHRRRRGNISCFGAVTRSSSFGPSEYSGSRGPGGRGSRPLLGGGGRWRAGSEGAVGARSSRIRRRVEDGRAEDERQAIDQCEQLRGVTDMVCTALTVTSSGQKGTIF
jgi:hypothetical protein